MCWSGEASAVLSLSGYATTYYCWKKGEPKELWVPLFYFTSMEALQAYTYTVINQCDNPHNQLATALGYLHIAFQPLFINALSLHFVPQKLRQKVQFPVFLLAFVSSILIILRMVPFDWMPSCQSVGYTFPFLPWLHTPVPFCGKLYCSMAGNWHIAWAAPVRFNFILDNAYLFGAFILPMLYGAWRITIYLTLAGPFLAFFTTSNANEWPAVWCLFSIAILGVAIKTPMRQWLYVRSWYGLAIKG